MEDVFVQAPRSGFLSQLYSGKQSYTDRPPRLFENFSMSVLALSDTSVDSHRVLASLENEKTANGKIETGTAEYIINIHQTNSDDTYKMAVKSMYQTGVGPFTAYYNSGQHKKADEKTNFYETFYTLRKIIFGSFKAIDDLIRLPSIVFAALQLLLERGGWKLQVLYKKTDNKILKAMAMIPAVVGLILNILGSVARIGVFASKIVAEAIRVPLAIMGGIFGLFFGGIVAIFQNVLDIGNNGNALVKSVPNSIFQGMLDGIRPFAPEFANNLQVALIKSSMNEAILRYPFEKISDDGQRRTATINPPWLSIAMFTLAVAAVIVFSTVTIGFGGLVSMPLLPYLFNLSAIAGGGASGWSAFTFMELGPVLSKLTMATMGLMAVGGIQAALVGIGRGFVAFYNDCVELGKPVVPAATVPTVATVPGSSSINSSSISSSSSSSTAAPYTLSSAAPPSTVNKSPPPSLKKV